MATTSAAFAIAIQHQQAGRLQAAEQIYRRILAADPKNAFAHNNLGVVCKDQERRDEAVACYRMALDLKPDFAEALNNLGLALREQGKLDEAAAACRRAIELKPGAAEPHNNLGNAFKDLGKPDEAIACYRRALEVNPGYAEAHNNLGNAFKDREKLDEAVASYRRALEIKPDYAEAHNNLGNAYKERGEPEAAVASTRRAVALRPDNAALHSNLLYAQLFCPGYDARTLFEEHRQWNQQHAAPLAKTIPPHCNDRTVDRRLRIGYVSPDFRDHCQASFTAPLFAQHDHESFEIVCYADVARGDRITARLQSHVDIWKRTTGLSHERLAEEIRRDGIDILVDLSMHMAGNRLLVFARKPAPVQVSWLAYPGTTGLTAIDYRITDPHLDPPGLFDDCYSEKSIRLPETFWCYEPFSSEHQPKASLSGEPQVNALPAAERDYICFGCFNNFCKVNPQVLHMWAQVLKAVDRSRLMIMAGEGSHRQRAVDLLDVEGVGRDRVTFVGRRPRAEYLNYYHEVDIGLDTLPYNGHTTSLESFWMGVPVVTLVGSTVVGRAGLCQLMNLGLPELIAASPGQYVEIAAALAHDVPRLRGLRVSLRERMRASPLMNARRFARNIEAAYRDMWRRWAESEG